MIVRAFNGYGSTLTSNPRERQARHDTGPGGHRRRVRRRPRAAAPPKTRARGLTAVADALEAARAEPVALAGAESNLGETRLNGELTRTTFQLKLFAEQVLAGEFHDARIDRPDPQWPSGPRPDLRRYRTAIGPVLVFAAGNSPPMLVEINSATGRLYGYLSSSRPAQRA